MFIYQSQLEAKIYEMAKPALGSMGYEIVRIRLRGGAKHKILQVMLDRMDGKQLTLEDCEKASSHLSVLLDAEDLIRVRYLLEMSSPGLDRPLTRYQDFVKNKGKEIRLSLKLMVNGRRNLTGSLVEVYDKSIAVFVPELGQEISISFDNVFEASLLYTFDKETINKRRK